MLPGERLRRRTPVGCGTAPTVAIPETIGAAGHEARATLVITDAFPAQWRSYQGVITFDPAILRFERIETAETLSEGMLAFGNETPPGTLLLAAAGNAPFVGNGDLIEGSVVGTGVYFARATAGEEVRTVRVVLAR